MFAGPVAPSLTPARGAELGQTTVYPEPSLSLLMVLRPPPSTKRRRELSLPPPLSVRTQLGVQRTSVLRRPLFRRIQPRVSLGPPAWLCPWLSFGCVLTCSDSRAVSFSVGSYLDPYATLSSRSHWYAPGCHVLRIQPHLDRNLPVPPDQPPCAQRACLG